MTKVLKIDNNDDVLVALVDLYPGDLNFEDLEIELVERVPRKHKFLIRDVEQGEQIMMYGVPVASANSRLKAGTRLTVENVRHFAESVTPFSNSTYNWQKPDISSWLHRTFDGYHRSDGKVGTANYWLFVPLVFCENRNLKVIEEALSKGLGYYKPNKYESYVHEMLSMRSDSLHAPASRYFSNIDGIRFLYHHGGCGGTRQDAEMLLRLLSGYVRHPNVAGATVLSLGCEHAQIGWFKDIQKELYGEADKPIFYLEQQRASSEESLIKQAISQTIEGMKVVNRIERKKASLDKLIVGLECGGSDGFSGISANPAVGRASDLIVSLGGISILSEFPELNGVEQNIINRCVNAEIANKFIDIQRAYEASARAAGSGFDMNPSPGNIRDGLITDAIKSAGAAKKGGRAFVADVLDYGEPVQRPGLNLLCTPGNDVESTTGLVGSGANIVLFTTGLGTPTGNPISPTIKISSNTELFHRMNDIIDLDAGTIASGDKTIDEVGDEILEKIISVASGEETKAMKLEQNDFIPWKRGVSL